MNCVLTGTSGYDYPEWKGLFYPEDLPRKDFLSYYATKLSGLEINNTFYNMPDKKNIQSLYDRTNGKLMFSIKANRLLTHEIGRQWKDAAFTLKEALSPLVQKNVLSTLLFQFPPFFDYTTENRFYLADLINEFNGISLVAEFRNKQWIRESVFEGLIKRNASLAFADIVPLKKDRTDFIGKEAYVRIHNDKKVFNDNELKQVFEIIKTTQNENRRIHFYFNKNPDASGVLNALKIKEATENQRQEISI